SERCDGIDERTLRRRIAHLCDAGLLTRQQSPNGKRFQLRDEAETVLMTYGIDLSPLFAIASHLEALATDCRREALRIKALRSLLRDRLFHAAETVPSDLREEARLSLRRQLTSEALEALLARFAAEAPCPMPTAVDLPASDSQNDRHIQSSNGESSDSEGAADSADRPTMADMQRHCPITQANDITVGECMELAVTARTMSPTQPQSWSEIVELSANLAPAIGLAPCVIRSAEAILGRHGCALAILGLVEAFERIRNPGAYLNTLIRRAQERGFDAVKMFRSLVGRRRTAGAWV
ncbi:MAG: replication initiation protein RepC, partial [Halothiobacillaceae bacterium]